MKKSLLFLLLLPLVAGCSPTNSDKIDINSTLNDFAKGIKVDVEVIETHKNESTTYYYTNTSKEKEFSYILYENEAKTKKLLHEYFVTGDELDDNLVYATRLNVNNEYNKYQMYNPYNSEFYTWDDGYNNAFLKLTSEYFTKVSDSTYILNADGLEKANKELVTLIYSNPGFDLSTLTLKSEKGTLYFEGTMTFSTTYNYEFTATIIGQGESVQADPRSVPFEEVKDANFENMIASLRAGNYTATMENYDGDYLETTNSFLITEDKVLFNMAKSSFGYYEVGEGYSQEVVLLGEDYYKSGSPTLLTVDEIAPLFDLNRACFDYENGVYTMKSSVEGSIYSVIPVMAFAEELDDFTIVITDDSYIFTNKIGYYKTVVTITNVGTTTIPFNADNVLEAEGGITWDLVLDEDSFNQLYNVAGEEAYNIPVPNGYYSWGFEYMEDEITLAFLLTEGSETLNDDLYDYAYALIDAGYTLAEDEPGFVFGGYMFLKEVTINDESHVLAVEIFQYYEAFGISIYVVE